MTVRFLAVYERPADRKTFDRHYRQTHLPLLRSLPGLRRYAVSRDVTALHGEPFYLVAELEWDTLDELRAAFSSPAGRATAADAARLQELAPVRRMILTVEEAGSAPFQHCSRPG
jgi:uncharacterized protein (TIGR02118 family)